MQVNGKEVKEIVRVIDMLHVEVRYVSGRTGIVHRTDLEEQSEVKEIQAEDARLQRAKG